MSRIHPSWLLILAVAAGFGFRPDPAAAAIYNVGVDGPGGGCEASTIEAAVALAGATAANDEIRIDSDVLYQPADTILLDDWSASTHGTLIVRGGYTSCTDTTAGSPPAEIDLMNADPGIKIRTFTSGDAIVTLQNLVLFNSSGRGLDVQWNSDVTLLSVELVFNDGGGLWVSIGGAHVYLDPSTTIHHNGPAANGGGIRCFNTDVVVESEAYIHHNTVSGNGGGINAEGCEVVLGSSSRIEANEAAGDGGGIYTGLSGLVSLFQDAVVLDNEASGWGGGIAASGPGAQVFLWGAKIHSNRSGSGGGGVYAENEAFLGAGGASCGAGFCPTTLEENELLAGARNGSAAMATDSGIVQLKQTAVLGNIVPEPEAFGSVFYVDMDGELRTESVKAFGNLGANRVFQVASGGKLRAAFTTAARNRYRNASNQLVEAYGLWAGGTNSEAKIFSSIFHPTAGYILDGQVSEQIDCLITQTTFGLPASSTEYYVLDPGYLNLATGDLRVGSASPAVDFCDNFSFTPSGGGLDGRARGHDTIGNPQAQPGPPGSQSLQDLGAYEFWDLALFSDGFQSGNTNAWSATVP